MKHHFFSISLVLFMINLTYPQQLDEINSILSTYNKPQSPGAALMIIKDGEVILKSCSGLADIENETPISPSTNFRLASITKQFTAASILTLIERGKLNYENNLQEIFPGFPEYGKKITIRHLLNHTSGLIDYEDLIPDTTTAQVKDKDVLEIMIQQDATYFEPGTKYQYSNTAYALLALTIENISGKSFGEYLKENIFSPLHMDNTVAHEEGISIVNNRAFGYIKRGEKFSKKDQSITSAVLGDGGIYSSIEDLYKWDQSLYTDKILSLNFMEESFKRNKLNSGEEINYGFGWHLKKFNGDEIVYHTGSTAGFRNIIYRIPLKKITLILLTNIDTGDEADKVELAEKIISLL